MLGQGHGRGLRQGPRSGLNGRLKDCHACHAPTPFSLVCMTCRDLFAQIADVLAASDDPASEYLKLQEMLPIYWTKLQLVFRYYCALDVEPCALSPRGFLALLSDCGLVGGKYLPKKGVVDIFGRAMADTDEAEAQFLVCVCQGW